MNTRTDSVSIRLLVAFAVALSAGALPLPSSHAVCVDYEETLRFEGSVSTPGSGRDIARVGDHFVVADGSFGLAVIDASDPTALELVTTFYTPGDAFDLQVAGNLVYLAAREGGLQIIDVTTPGVPFLRGIWPTPNSSKGVRSPAISPTSLRTRAGSRW